MCRSFKKNFPGVPIFYGFPVTDLDRGCSGKKPQRHCQQWIACWRASVPPHFPKPILTERKSPVHWQILSDLRHLRDISKCETDKAARFSTRKCCWDEPTGFISEGMNFVYKEAESLGYKVTHSGSKFRLITDPANS